MPTLNFSRAIDFVLRHEVGPAYMHADGWSAAPGDPGGDTRYGISQKAYPTIELASLTQNQATAIYYRDFWKSNSCGKLPGCIAVALFDSAVNCGTQRACKWVQLAYNMLYDEPLQVDGIIGPITIGALSLGFTAARLLAFVLLSLRRDYYISLAGKLRYRPYLRGWLARVADLEHLIIQEENHD
jgi:lysozyme family protein